MNYFCFAFVLLHLFHSCLNNFSVCLSIFYQILLYLFLFFCSFVSISHSFCYVSSVNNAISLSQLLFLSILYLSLSPLSLSISLSLTLSRYHVLTLSRSLSFSLSLVLSFSRSLILSFSLVLLFSLFLSFSLSLSLSLFICLFYFSLTFFLSFFHFLLFLKLIPELRGRLLLNASTQRSAESAPIIVEK